MPFVLSRVLHGLSTCASAASAWGSQKIMSMARYISIAVDNSVGRIYLLGEA
jgi:hypothetical protein